MANRNMSPFGAALAAPIKKDAVSLSSDTGISLEKFMDLRWVDYNFETACLHFRSTPEGACLKLCLSEAMRETITNRYNSYISENGRAPRLGDNIFTLERIEKHG